MIRFGNTLPVCCLLAASALAPAQTPPPPPPAPPAPVAAPAPMPMPAPRPMVRLEDFPDLVDADSIAQTVEAAMAKVDFDAIGEQASRAAEMAMQQDMKLRDFEMNAGDFEMKAQEMAARATEKWGGLMALAQQTPIAPKAPMPPMPPVQVYGPGQFRFSKNTGIDTLYDRGQRALDNRSYDQALDAFSEVVSRGGARADAALYWKAYTLNKLGRRDDATAALNELRTKFASSRWADDAKALEIEVKQSSGQKVAPESQSDDELKLLALNGLMQSDPDRAIPILERLLKGAQSPRVKRDAIYVLAANSNPKAQQLLDQIARGSTGNPDLQLQAIQYLGRTKQTNRAPLLMEIYNSTSDLAVKRAILNSLNSGNDKDRLLQMAKAEKNADLRMEIIRRLASSGDQADIWQFYQAETDPNTKIELLRMMNGNSERMIEIARSEKDAKLRRAAVQSLAGVKSPAATDAMIAMYSSETDPQVKRSIVNVLFSQRNVTALVQLGRKESDPDMKREIVRELVSMKSPEATQFLEEILK